MSVRYQDNRPLPPQTPPPHTHTHTHLRETVSTRTIPPPHPDYSPCTIPTRSIYPALRKEQTMVKVTRAQITAGNPPLAERKRYIDSSRSIRNIVDSYGDRHVLDNLRDIAMNFQF